MTTYKEATLHTSKGDIVIELFPNHAPKTVANFVELASGAREWVDPRNGEKTTANLYDGTIFHRVIKDFMIQGGDPLGKGTGGPGYKFADEFHPELSFNKPYLLAMANAAGTEIMKAVSDDKKSDVTGTGAAIIANLSLSKGPQAGGVSAAGRVHRVGAGGGAGWHSDRRRRAHDRQPELPFPEVAFDGARLRGDCRASHSPDGEDVCCPAICRDETLGVFD